MTRDQECRRARTPKPTSRPTRGAATTAPSIEPVTGPAAQLAEVHRTLRRGPAFQRVAEGAAGAQVPDRDPNRTGLPDRLKAGAEALSGISLDDVRVHRDSPKPAQLNALAYAQGSDIHLAPGQDAHLPHEAWHVVQQRQGRVKPTIQLKEGVAINDDAGLEREADVMGARALVTSDPRHALVAATDTGPAVAQTVVQRTILGLKGENIWSTQIGAAVFALGPNEARLKTKILRLHSTERIVNVRDFDDLRERIAKHEFDKVLEESRAESSEPKYDKAQVESNKLKTEKERLDREASPFTSKLDNLDGIEGEATSLVNRANALTIQVPTSLRKYWKENQVFIYDIVGTFRAKVKATKEKAKPGKYPLEQVRKDVADHALRLLELRLAIKDCETIYAKYADTIAMQAARFAQLGNVLKEPQGKPKLAEWVALAEAVHAMNDKAIGAALATFRQDLEVGLFSEDEVAKAREMGDGKAEKVAVIDYLTDLFSSGKARLDTWSKTYPTAYDLKTGEFGAEWYVYAPGAKWLNANWVFHAHCETIRDKDSTFIGFRFKAIVGTNHLKMINERKKASVQLDLPLSRQALDALAQPYQDEFLRRLSSGQLEEAIRKAKGK
jgi:hypothetical protein